MGTPGSQIEPALASTPATEEYTIVHTGGPRTKHRKPRPELLLEDEPLLDATAPLVLISKKTKRLEKQQLKKQKQARKQITSILDLPSELLQEILAWLKPSELSTVATVSKTLQSYIQQNESSLARSIVRKRYSILSRCLPLPMSVSALDGYTQSILLNSKRQEMLNIHKKPYQHIQPIDPHQVCSCTWCVFCWNNLCLVLDLAHFQSHLDRRDPLPVIPRGSTPSWNIELIAQNGRKVQSALRSPLAYTRILETHLHTIIRTITRQHTIRKSTLSASGKWIPTKSTLQAPVYRDRPYQLTDAEAALQSDFFLERAGAPSYEFPYFRDWYYNLEVHVPNRKWSESELRWRYYNESASQHERDVALALRWFAPKVVDAEVVGGSVREVFKEQQLELGDGINKDTLFVGGRHEKQAEWLWKNEQMQY